MGLRCSGGSTSRRCSNQPNFTKKLDSAVNLVRLHLPAKALSFLGNIWFRKRPLGFAKNPMRFGGDAKFHVVKVAACNNTFGCLDHALGLFLVILDKPIDAGP